MQFTDTASVTGTRRSADGYLIADACAVRTGVQLYAGAEVGDARPVVRVYRPEAEVRAADSLRSFSHAPVTVGHPVGGVTADTWKALAVGEVSTDAEWTGNRIRLPLILKDAAAIRLVEGGTRELSAGYTCDLAFEDGTTPEGEAYDAVQRNIRINHLAIVPKGRAGSECRIGDADAWGVAPITMSDKEADMADALETVVLGDEAVQVAATDAAKIDKWKADQAKALTDAKADHDKAITARDEEIGKLKADLKAAQDAAPKPGDLDRMAADRAALVAAVQTIAKDVKPEGLSDADLRKAAVAARLGDEAVKDASEAEIKGMFTAISKTADAASPDPVRSAMKDAKPTLTADKAEADAYAAYLADFNPAQQEAS